MSRLAICQGNFPGPSTSVPSPLPQNQPDSVVSKRLVICKRRKATGRVQLPALDAVTIVGVCLRNAARYPMRGCGLTKNCGDVRDMVDFWNRVFAL